MISIKFKAIVVQLYTYVNKEGQNTFQFKKTTKFSNVATWVLMMESSSG